MAFIYPRRVFGFRVVDDRVLQRRYDALVRFLEGRNEVVHFPKVPPVDAGRCLSTPGPSFCLGQSVGINITLMQHTEAVGSWDALAVPQQVAAISARCQQQLLPSLTGDAPMVDGQRIHAAAVSHCGRLSPCTSLPLTAPQPCAPLSISVSEY